MFNIAEHIGDDNNFTDGFKGAALADLGDDYKDNKALDTIKNPSGLVKAFLDTKADVGKKMDGVLQKPADNATEEQKAEYHTALLKELGTPEKAEDYEFSREGMPEEGYDEEMEAGLRKFFFEKNWPKSMVAEVVGEYNKLQLGRANAVIEAQQKQFTTNCEKLDKDWTGDARTENNRMVFKAIMKFGNDDLKKVLKESKLNTDENISNHQKWLETGFNTIQRQVWLNIARATGVSPAITDEGSEPGSGGGKDDTAKAVEKIYDHPSSQAHRKTREAASSN